MRRRIVVALLATGFNGILIGNDVNSFLPKAYISILVALATLTPNGGETEGWMPLSMASVDTN